MTWPETLKLRDWQHRAFEAWKMDGFTASGRGRTYTANVTPGAGKTIFALRCANEFVNRVQQSRRIVVVVHTANLRMQWAEQAKEVGLTLRDDWSPGDRIAKDEHIIVTYQQIASKPQAISAIVGTRSTMVIFDEIHHVADDATWGLACRKAVGKVQSKLLLSGTPFRHDESRIAFVSYKSNQAVVNFEYGYAEALADGIVEPVFFPTMEATSKYRVNGETFDINLDDVEDDEQSGRSLRTISHASGGYMQTVIRAADERIKGMRSDGHLLAKGMIVAVDQAHARKLKLAISRETGETPALAISDNPASHDIIRDFNTDSRRWMVSVKMVSEGVDIPNLRVGIYATNVQTELFFRQFVGRFTRRRDFIKSAAYIYVPRHATLLAHVAALQSERQHVIKPETTIERNSSSRGANGTYNISVLDTSAELGEMLAADGDVFSAEELRIAEIVRVQSGMSYLTVEAVAQILRVGKVVERVHEAPMAAVN